MEPRKLIEHLPAKSFILTLLVMVLGACAATPTQTPPPTPDESLIFGIIMVGPHDDHGWSEAHYSAGRYVEDNISGSRMIYLDSLNPNDRPETTLEEAVDDMVDRGARLVFITSDDFAVDTSLAAQKYPDITFVHLTGDHVLKGEASPNLGNYMGRMVYGKMIAGCAAALATNSGSIAYLGPLINDETRRLVNSAYLGADYCYRHYRSQSSAELDFRVEWIGFWFHIPGVTADPTEVSNNLFDQGADVLLSGIDTTEALAVTADRAAAGEEVLAIPYDYEYACDEAPDVCLGVPYFNWGPAYLESAQAVIDGTWTQDWEWTEPDWTNLNNRDTSPIGFRKGRGLTKGQSAQLDQFIAGLADGSIVLFTGALNYQDGSPFLAEGETAADEQVWYMPQLLAGMEGLSE